MADRTTPPHVLLSVGPALLGVHDIVRPPLLHDDAQLLSAAIVVLGSLCAVAGARQLVGSGLLRTRLWPLGLSAFVVAVMVLTPSPEGGSFSADLLLRLGPALLTVSYAALALTWRPSRLVAAAFAGVVLVATADVLVRPLATEWMITAAVDARWGPLSPSTVGVLAFEVAPVLIRACDGCALLIVPCLALAARGDRASTP